MKAVVLGFLGRTSTGRRPAWLGPALTWSAGVLAALALLFAAVFVWLALSLPLADPSDPPRPSLLLEAVDGRVFATRGSFRGDPAELADLPPHLIDAVMAIEDRRFRSHLGVDLRGIARALVANVTAGGVREGGSTITQQLARLLYLSQERTVRRKLQEAMLAVWLELRLGKDEILQRYLNEVYFGAGAFGVEGAARRYFRKAARELSLSEAAMLAGLIQAPSDYAPTRDLALAQERASVVLGAMVDAGVLSEESAAVARAAPAAPVVEPEAVPGRAYFADWIGSEANAWLGPLSADYAVRTTLDLELQALAERVIAEHLAAEGAEKQVGQAALVALGADGAVLAMVGGRDYRESQFNRATQARRQPGSLFKLFVYLAAFEAGLTPDTVLVDEPVRIGDWEPENHSGRFMGPVELRTAFALSLNSIAVKLMQQVGPERVIDVARRLGIASPLEPNPSLALGTSGTTLIEITRAYAAVATGRLDLVPYGIAAVRAGERAIDLRPRPAVEPAPPMPWRRELLDMLLATVRSGTGRAAALDRRSAGKTGTTQGYRDAWYVGFTADAVVGVWVGNDDATPTARVSGADLPARIWHEFMQEADRVKAAPPPPP